MSEMSFPESPMQIKNPPPLDDADKFFGEPEPKPEPELEPEFEPEIQMLIDQATMLTDDNKKLMKWLSESGVVREISGVGESRHELFFDFLKEVGIIPLKVGVLFEVKWARAFNERLSDLKRQAEEHIANQESERIRQTLLTGVHLPHAAQMAAKNSRPGKV